MRTYQFKWMKARRDAWLLTNGPCRQCRSWDRLEVDHVDRSSKVDHKVWSWSKPRREAELAKCQVLCRTCHQQKTFYYERGQRRQVHGTVWCYQRFRCRCADCRKARSDYERARRVRRRAA